MIVRTIEPSVRKVWIIEGRTLTRLVRIIGVELGHQSRHDDDLCKEYNGM